LKKSSNHRCSKFGGGREKSADRGGTTKRRKTGILNSTDQRPEPGTAIAKRKVKKGLCANRLPTCWRNAMARVGQKLRENWISGASVKKKIHIKVTKHEVVTRPSERRVGT